MIKRVPGWANIRYDWGHGCIETKQIHAGFQFLAFDFIVTSNGAVAVGSGGAYALSDADNKLFASFNRFLDSFLPPQPKLEDLAEFKQFLRARKPRCSHAPDWPRVGSSPEFSDLQHGVVSSFSFRSEFLDQGTFARKQSVISMNHDYVLYEGALWTLDVDLPLWECTSVIDGMLRRERQRLDYLKNGGTSINVRERIPEAVRNEVWRRDLGKCARCGSRDKLEFDHVVPVSLGGGNTARNIELLCESCNRAKSSSI